jgi:DNA (cytosine-5)-methyltransferase 1
MGFNKGEWSELYTLLYLMEQPSLVIVDENLKVSEENLFRLLEIILGKKKYKIVDDKIIKIVKNKEIKEYKIECISKQNALLLQKILAHKKAKGSFEIQEIEALIDDLFDGKKPKGSSKVKGDLEANVLDNQRSKIVNLKYNIKSNLGSKATLLNASSHTNFIYELKNINDEIMNENNGIKSRKKLLERCEFLNQYGVTVEFVKVESTVFNYNLKLIDSNLDNILAQMLYLSYSKNEKDIEELIKLIGKNQDDYNFYKKKMGDFSNAVTFGMRAGEKWNGVNEVNGGIILVTKTGEVYLLDLVYFKEIVDKYLINNIKLDSPSSKRYKMFEIYQENGRYYFKLNLQIRFK